MQKNIFLFLSKLMKKKINSKIKNSLKLLDKIERVRQKNNKNWMDILRLSIKLDQKKTSKILYEIYSQDKKISNLAKKLYKI